MIYGFTDINFNIASSKMNEAGSYLFIPQVNFYLFAFFFFFFWIMPPHIVLIIHSLGLEDNVLVQSCKLKIAI